MTTPTMDTDDISDTAYEENKELEELSAEERKERAKEQKDVAKYQQRIKELLYLQVLL